MKDLRFHFCTWNVGSSDPLNEPDFLKLLEIQPENNVDAYVIGLQEIQTSAKETALSFISYDEWAEKLMKVLSKRGFYMVESIRLQGMSLSVFFKRVHLPFVRFVRTSYERTGFGGNWGNKGGVAISMWLYGERLCFLNTHLPPHLKNKKERVEAFYQIIDDIDFGETANILSHDATFWIGDTNFRIDTITREDTIQLVEKKNFLKLIENDQLIKHQPEDDMMRQFKEGPITFPPTYKFDPGTDVYDTSEKQRKPAWTDRILLRINPDALHMLERLSVSDGNKCASYIKQVKDSYKSHPYLTISDHKPVSAQYTIQTRKDQSALIELDIEGVWKSDSPGILSITYNPGMLKDAEDYLALYQENFTDFRAYLKWVYVPESSDSERVVAKKRHRVEFPGFDTKDSPVVKYRLGFYSNKMLCLLAVSEPFEIKA